MLGSTTQAAATPMTSLGPAGPRPAREAAQRGWESCPWILRTLQGWCHKGQPPHHPGTHLPPPAATLQAAAASQSSVPWDLGKSVRARVQSLEWPRLPSAGKNSAARLRPFLQIPFASGTLKNRWPSFWLPFKPTQRVAAKYTAQGICPASQPEKNRLGLWDRGSSSMILSPISQSITSERAGRRLKDCSNRGRPSSIL